MGLAPTRTALLADSRPHRCEPAVRGYGGLRARRLSCHLSGPNVTTWHGGYVEPFSSLRASYPALRWVRPGNSGGVGSSTSAIRDVYFNARGPFEAKS